MRILMAYDGTIEGQRALLAAPEIALLPHDETHLLAVLPMPAGLFLAEGYVPGQVIDEEGAIKTIRGDPLASDPTAIDRFKQEIRLARKITNKHVLIVEDIVDTGLTLSRLLEILGTRGAASIRLASFLDKPEPRIKKELKIDYTGFVIPNKFVVGYGLDAAGRYRNLPFIAVVKNPAEA